MMKNPLVSIILDNYNYADFLGETIQSVLSQTYCNYEILLVDDGSTDHSKEIILQYALQCDRIVPIFKENGGQTSAFNAAFKKASGEIIALLDSDDYWYPQKLEKIVEKHKKYEFVQHYLSNNGSGIYRKVNTSINWHRVLNDYGFLYNHSVSSSLSFSKKLLEPFFPLIKEEEMRYCTDGILVMIALSLTEVGFIEEELGFYRIHGKNGFVGKSDFGKAAREILERQHHYTNLQLQDKGFAPIPFSAHKYLRKIVEDMLLSGNISTEDVFVLYGTESSGLYLSEVLESLGCTIYAYIDSSESKQGTEFRGKMIYSANKIYEVKKHYTKILIASSAQEDIRNTLVQEGFKEETDFYRLPI